MKELIKTFDEEVEAIEAQRKREERRRQEEIRRANEAEKRRWQQQREREEARKRAAEQTIEEVRKELEAEQELQRQAQRQQQQALFNLVLGPSIRDFQESQRRVRLCMNTLDGLIKEAARGSIDGQTFYTSFWAFQDAFKLTSKEKRMLMSELKQLLSQSPSA